MTHARQFKLSASAACKPTEPREIATETWRAVKFFPFPLPRAMANVLETHRLTTHAIVLKDWRSVFGLSAKGELRKTIERTVREQMDAARADNTDMTILRKRREVIAAKLSFVIDELDAIGRDVAKGKINQLQSQLRALDEQIGQAVRMTAIGDQDFEAVVASVLEQFADLARNIHELPPIGLRGVIQLLVAKLEVDLETKTVQIEIGLPPWAINSAEAIKTACASATDLHAGEQPRHTAGADFILALLDCQQQKQGRSVCYSCARRRAA